MQWSNAVLKKENAEKIVMDFVPIKFELGTPEVALNYLENKSSGSDFRMSEAVRTQTGIENIEKESEKERIEELTLIKLKEVQEEAYQQAYDLGLQEGQEKVFKKYSQELEEKLKQLNELIQAISSLKNELLLQNEAHFVRLSFEIAKKMAYKQIEIDEGIVLEILKTSIQNSQQDETIQVQVSEAQLQFLEKMQTERFREFDFLKKVKFEANSEIQSGGCLIQTNYGEIDARVSERVEKLWEQVQEALPKVKSQLTG